MNDEIRISSTLARRWRNWHKVYVSGHGTPWASTDYLLFYYLPSGERIVPDYMDRSVNRKVDSYTVYDRFGNFVLKDKSLNNCKMQVYKMLEKEHKQRMK